MHKYIKLIIQVHKKRLVPKLERTYRNVVACDVNHILLPITYYPNDGIFIIVDESNNKYKYMLMT